MFVKLASWPEKVGIYIYKPVVLMRFMIIDAQFWVGKCPVFSKKWPAPKPLSLLGLRGMLPTCPPFLLNYVLKIFQFFMKK